MKRARLESPGNDVFVGCFFPKTALAFKVLPVVVVPKEWMLSLRIGTGG